MNIKLMNFCVIPLFMLFMQSAMAGVISIGGNGKPPGVDWNDFHVEWIVSGTDPVANFREKDKAVKQFKVINQDTSVKPLGQDFGIIANKWNYVQFICKDIQPSNNNVLYKFNVDIEDEMRVTNLRHYYTKDGKRVTDYFGGGLVTAGPGNAYPVDETPTLIVMFIGLLLLLITKCNALRGSDKHIISSWV